MTTTPAVAVPPSISEALRSASARTGTGFDYLLKTAIRESGLKPGARAPTSSATGLFQFVEQTWLGLLKDAGPAHGLASYAGDISRSGDRYEVADPAARREILALREDPGIAALMAGELTRRNEAELGAALGRKPSDGELYIGHFLGAQGGADLIRAAGETPRAAAADLFPAAARSNRSIFYSQAGGKRSTSEVYANLVRHHDRAGQAAEPREAVTPFAGIIAFFERLFSPPDRPQEPVVRRSAPAEVGIASRSDSDAGSSERALAARVATSAYRRQAALPPDREIAGVGIGARDLGPLYMPPPWTHSLFANAERPGGPLVPTGQTKPA